MSIGRTTADTVHDARVATVGAMEVRRALPRRGLRTVGAWCFADHFGPETVTETQGLDVGPHPHIGLQTVTWLVEGAVLHRDSLGSEELIRPGELNLMTAGRGIVHAEEASHTYRGTLHGVQLWIAQPSETRDGGSAFAHHADLPRIDLGHGEGSVLIGEFAGATSDAKVDTPLVGMEAVLRAGTSTWALRPEFEYAAYVIEGEASIGGAVARRGQLRELGSGLAEVTAQVRDDARILLLGGEPLGEPLHMWWNFVGRSRHEVVAAQESWAEYLRSGESERFARVDSTLGAIPAPPLP